MTFYSVRDLRTKSGSIWKNLSKKGEAVITNNGKPAALLLNLQEDNFEETLAAVRQAKAIHALNRIQAESVKNGLDKTTDGEIEAEIAAYRKGR